MAGDCDYYLASTHGDHTTKITSFKTKKIIRVFRGHPRTPWSVKFHPRDPNIVASGCLGGHIIIWDIEANKVVAKTRVDCHIISLAFSPDGRVLAIAGTSSLKFWHYGGKPRIAPHMPLVDDGGTLANPETSFQNLRCVRFLPCGKKIIIGLIRADQVQRQIGSVVLNLWNVGCSSSGQVTLHNKKRICQYVQLYSDGGIDVSKCGKYVVTCTASPNPDSGNILAMISLRERTFGRVTECVSFPGVEEVKHTTSVKLSPSQKYVIVGRSSVDNNNFTHKNPVICVYDISACPARPVCQVNRDGHDSNMCLFHPLEGRGFIYGTKDGKVVRVRFGPK